MSCFSKSRELPMKSVQCRSGKCRINRQARFLVSCSRRKEDYLWRKSEIRCLKSFMIAKAFFKYVESALSTMKRRQRKWSLLDFFNQKSHSAEHFLSTRASGLLPLSFNRLFVLIVLPLTFGEHDQLLTATIVIDFKLKDLEKLGPKKGVISQSVKDVVQSLVDDDLVFKDKIGTSVSHLQLSCETCL